MTDYHGHKTLADGSHVKLTSDEAERLWNDATRQKEERAAKKEMPILGEFLILGVRPQTADQAEEKQQRERPQQDTRSDGGEPLPF